MNKVLTISLVNLINYLIKNCTILFYYYCWHKKLKLDWNRGEFLTWTYPIKPIGFLVCTHISEPWTWGYFTKDIMWHSDLQHLQKRHKVNQQQGLLYRRLSVILCLQNLCTTHCTYAYSKHNNDALTSVHRTSISVTHLSTEGFNGRTSVQSSQGTAYHIEDMDSSLKDVIVCSDSNLHLIFQLNSKIQSQHQHNTHLLKKRQVVRATACIK